MRHRKKRLQLNRFTSWRRATLISLARNLFTHQSIRTSKTKAKAVKPVIEKLISLAKLNTLTARRRAYITLGDHQLVSLLFNDIGQRFQNQPGGYTRTLGLGVRRGDNAEMVILELTQIKKKEPGKPKKEKEIKVTPTEFPAEEKKVKTEVLVKEKPPLSQKPSKKFLGGLRKIFKKERDSL